jgi:hypothetical protein
MLLDSTEMVMTWGVPRIEKPTRISRSTPHSDAGTVESTQLAEVPADALVSAASATLTLRPAPEIQAVAVARVRQGEDNTTIVLDFGALRTVSGLTLPAGSSLSTLSRWNGSAFAPLTDVKPVAGELTLSFGEQQTERLQLGFAAAMSEATATAGLRVVIPSAPSDLELEVGGVLAWSRPGSVRFTTGADNKPTVTFEVDISQALQTALARGANPQVRLRTATPCAHSLGVTVDFLRVHQVNLPPSGIAVDVDSEAVVDTFLPLPAASGNWKVVRVDLGVSGRMPAWRAWPLPDGPLNPAARLVIDAAHSYAARLPAGWLAPLAELSGIRLPLVLAKGFGGAELVALLHDGSASQPITPLAAARFLPCVVDASPGGETRWVELHLSKPVKVQPKPFWWIEISATRGQCDWPLTAAGGETDPDEIRLRRSLPGPPFRHLAVQIGHGPTALQPAGRLRVLGTPRSDELRPGVVPVIEGLSVLVAPGFTPTPKSGVVSLRLPDATPASAAHGDIVDQQLRLRLRMHGAGQISLNTATVYYSDTAP